MGLGSYKFVLFVLKEKPADCVQQAFFGYNMEGQFKFLEMLFSGINYSRSFG